MKRLVNTKGMDTLTWLKYRRMGVCGSDAGIVLGLSSHRSIIELWKDKSNQIPIEETGNNFTHFGHLLERIIRKEFSRQTGYKVEVRNCIFQSETHPFMLADIDGIVTLEDGSKAIFEAKTAIEWKNDTWQEGVVPPAYYAQLQHYMHVCDLNKAYIACLVGGNKFYFQPVERNTEYIEMLKKAGLVFSGMSPDGMLSEIVELPHLDWFVAAQFHPEFKSRPEKPHPLFRGLITAAIKQKEEKSE